MAADAAGRLPLHMLLRPATKQWCACCSRLRQQPSWQRMRPAGCPCTCCSGPPRSNGAPAAPGCASSRHGSRCGRPAAPAHAAQARHEAMVRLLLQAAPAAVMAADAAGQLPLHVAATLRRASVVRLLLKAVPATAMAADTAGYLPLHLAAHHGDAEMVCVLLQAAPQAATVVAAGRTPLQLAYTSEARAMLGAGPAAAVLATLKAAGAAALAIPDFLLIPGRLPLDATAWAEVPSPCPGIERALPAALACSIGQAAQVVQRLQHWPGCAGGAAPAALARLRRWCSACSLLIACACAPPRCAWAATACLALWRCSSWPAACDVFALLCLHVPSALSSLRFVNSRCMGRRCRRDTSSLRRRRAALPDVCLARLKAIKRCPCGIVYSRQHAPTHGIGTRERAAGHVWAGGPCGGSPSGPAGQVGAWLTVRCFPKGFRTAPKPGATRRDTRAGRASTDLGLSPSTGFNGSTTAADHA